MQATVTIAAIVVHTVVCLFKKIDTLTAGIRQLNERLDALERKLPSEAEYTSPVTQDYEANLAGDDGVGVAPAEQA
jgi:hypothetical protein